MNRVKKVPDVVLSMIETESGVKVIWHDQTINSILRRIPGNG